MKTQSLARPALCVLAAVCLSLTLLATSVYPQASTRAIRWYAGNTEESGDKYGVKATITVPSTNPYSRSGTFTAEWVSVVDAESCAWVQAGWAKGIIGGTWHSTPTAYIERYWNQTDGEVTAYGTLALNSIHTFQIDWGSTYSAWRVLIDGSNKGWFNGGSMNAPQSVEAYGEVSDDSNTMGPSTFNPVKYANSSLSWYNFSSSNQLKADSPYSVSGYPYNFNNWGP